MDLTEILETLSNGKISVAKAQKLLSLYSIEKIEEFAKIDTGRKIRNGVPEVIFAEKKQLSEIKKIISKVLTKTDLVLVSRIQKKHFEKIVQHCKNNKLKIKKGKNTYIYPWQMRWFVRLVRILPQSFINWFFYINRKSATK